MKVFALFLTFILLTGSSLNDARKANQAYENGNYEEAAELYRSAITEDPDNPKLHFNLGNALAKMGNAEQAEAAFSRYKSLVEKPVDESLADYNTGKMLTDMEQYDQALNYFRDALKNNPEDEDARHNYELALRKQQEQQQKMKNSSPIQIRTRIRKTKRTRTPKTIRTSKIRTKTNLKTINNSNNHRINKVKINSSPFLSI